MKTVNSNLSTAIRSSYNVETRPQLIAEWNMNRYYDTTVDNIPNEDENNFDDELFPIDTITQGFRPTKGVSKVRIGEAAVYQVDSGNNTNRYYTADDEDVYKYWTSPQQTNGGGTFPNHTDGVTVVRPHVIYASNVSINKIVIKIDNYWASPNLFYIKTTLTNTPTYPSDWVTVATSPTIANDGTITLYWNGTNWGTTKPTLINPSLKTLRGIMVEVASMTSGKKNDGTPTIVKTASGSEYTPNGFNSYFNLIEISGRREVDLTDRLIAVDDTQDMSTVSELYPIGTLTSNSGNITLSNLYTDTGVQKTGYFSKSNASSIYKNILEPNVKFTLSYIYTIAAVDYSVQQFEMYGGEWQGLVSDEVSISLNDSSTFLKELYPRPFMVENTTVPEIIQRVLDSVGFVKWGYAVDDRVTPDTIPVFWATGEDNVWEILNDLAEGTQSGIYFDAFGILWVKTREMAYDKNKLSSWTLRGDKSGNELPDIISLEQGEDLGANKLTVNYQTTKWDVYSGGNAAFSKVWEPDGTTVLRASQLVRSLGPTHDSFYVPQNDVKLWPYEGIVQIEGELIKYKGKRFTYYTGASGNTPNLIIVTSADEYKKYNEKTARQYRHKNFFDGGLFIELIDGNADNGRGYWNSEKRNHSVDMANYSVRSLQISNGSIDIANASANGLTHLRLESAVRLKNPGHFTGNDMTIATIGSTVDTSFKYYGARFKFVKDAGNTTHRAGIAFNNNTNENGYYVELNAGIQIPEVALFSQKSGNLKKLTSTGVAVTPGIWQELDISVSGNTISVWVNGLVRIQYTVQSGDQNTDNGKFGMFARGRTEVKYEYLYGIARDEQTLEDDSTYFNLIDGGYTGSHWDREWVFGWKTKKKRKKKRSTKQRYRWNNYFFDEFGPYVHEVREFDVKFDPAPVKSSRLFLTNEAQAIAIEYRSSSFGAQFVLANASRYNCVVNGDDNLTLGGNRTIPQVLNIIGNQLTFADTEFVEVSDDSSISIRGKVESELTSKWVQNKDMATSVSNWMKAHWSIGIDQLTVDIFGNPLFEIGDVVSIEYPDRYLTAATHKYFITSIRNEWNNGIETSLGLRRMT